jgi:dipeptidyl aminopeptidase/acylaminoacyl peptidase
MNEKFKKNLMKKNILPFCFLFLSVAIQAQQASIETADNLVIEGIPALPSSLVDEVKNYTETRGASLADWHPLNAGMLISTRFGNSNQLHYVKMPEGARRQITFFDEPIGYASFEPVKGNYFLFLKDIGGNEFSQIYRYNLSTNQHALVTDGGRTQNGGIRWNHAGDKIAYGSTRRNGQDRDIYIMDPLDPASGKIVAENKGGGWSVSGWSPDDSRLLLQEYVSVNESRLYLADTAYGTKTRIIPGKDERSTFTGIGFTKDGTGIYLVTNRDSEFNRLACLNLSTRELEYITGSIPWDVEDAALSKDGSLLAFAMNENGLSRLYCLTTETNQFSEITGIPTGLVAGLSWSGDSRSIGISLITHNSLSDIYEYNTVTKKLIRWTESELGGIDVSSLKEPKLISWKSFDGRTLSGYLYTASGRFSGKRPVIVSIHGGPENQARPGFIGRLNYFLMELGISIIYPNVRGSTGYGKTFADLDNGKKREESVKDIGALIDWIARQPDLDGDRIMITGGSYGGYMTLAVSYMYSDKIRCSIDVVGISNFNTFLKNTEAYRRDLRRAEYGDERDPEMAAYFESIAPLNHTDKIRKPIFIVQGGNDPRVPLSESVQMKDKIREQGTTVWYLMAKDEGHGFRKKNNADFQFYSTVEFIRRFLLD